MRDLTTLLILALPVILAAQGVESWAIAGVGVVALVAAVRLASGAPARTGDAQRDQHELPPLTQGARQSVPRRPPETPRSLFSLPPSVKSTFGTGPAGRSPYSDVEPAILPFVPRSQAILPKGG